MNKAMIQMYDNILLIKLGILLLIFVAVVILVLRVFNVRSLLGDDGVTQILGNIKSNRKRDLFVYNSTKFLSNIARIVQLTPFALNDFTKDYLNYNLKRANVLGPDNKVLPAEQYNALIVIITGILLALSFVICFVFNMAVGIISMLCITLGASILPMTCLRGAVKKKDLEIKRNFPDCYLMIHYVLISGGKTPVTKVLKTYAKTTTSEEMIRFISVATSYMDSYGEESALNYITQDYREIAEIGKLMRLMKQINDGGNVKNDLLGFRDELVKAKKYEKMKRMKVIIRKAKVSFYILMPILIQAIISAMAIYLPDIVGGSSMLF